MFKFISIKTHTVKGKSDGIITLPHIIIPRSTPVLQISEKTINTVIKINNKEYKNVKLTFDCWFESGCSCLIEFNNKSQDLHKIQDNTIKTCSFTNKRILNLMIYV